MSKQFEDKGQNFLLGDPDTDLVSSMQDSIRSTYDMAEKAREVLIGYVQGRIEGERSNEGSRLSNKSVD